MRSRSKRTTFATAIKMSKCGLSSKTLARTTAIFISQSIRSRKPLSRFVCTRTTDHIFSEIAKRRFGMPSAISKALRITFLVALKDRNGAQLLSVRSTASASCRELSDGLRVPMDEMLPILREKDVDERSRRAGSKFGSARRLRRQYIRANRRRGMVCDLCDGVFEQVTSADQTSICLREKIKKKPP